MRPCRLQGFDPPERPYSTPRRLNPRESRCSHGVDAPIRANLDQVTTRKPQSPHTPSTRRKRESPRRTRSSQGNHPSPPMNLTNAPDVPYRHGAPKRLQSTRTQRLVSFLSFSRAPPLHTHQPPPEGVGRIVEGSVSSLSSGGSGAQPHPLPLQGLSHTAPKGDAILALFDHLMPVSRPPAVEEEECGVDVGSTTWGFFDDRLARRASFASEPAWTLDPHGAFCPTPFHRPPYIPKDDEVVCEERGLGSPC